MDASKFRINGFGSNSERSRRVYGGSSSGGSRYSCAGRYSRRGVDCACATSFADSNSRKSFGANLPYAPVQVNPNRPAKQQAWCGYVNSHLEGVELHNVFYCCRIGKRLLWQWLTGGSHFRLPAAVTAVQNASDAFLPCAKRSDGPSTICKSASCKLVVRFG